MLGQLVYRDNGRGRAERIQLYDLPLLRAEIPTAGLWRQHRLHRAARQLFRHQVRLALVPEGFSQWEALRQWSISPVDTTPLLRALSAPLALVALADLGIDPAQATVTLLGRDGDRDIARTAQALCPQVRHLVLSSQGLADWLRREYGIPVLPPDSPSQLTICFGAYPHRPSSPVLDLSAGSAGLAGLVLSCPALKPEDQQKLSLLTALWQHGKISLSEIKVFHAGTRPTFSPP